jgi:quercetin dioxygenase-like cupin family protein
MQKSLDLRVEETFIGKKMEESKPYTENKKSNGIIERTFDPNIEQDECVWHRDKKNRVVTILDGHGWYLQMDEGLPYEMKKHDVIYIPKEKYHRIYKIGTDALKIQITESD